ncbi:MAG TPA: MFS transporter [Streptosporangiaceae bacterium]
MQTSPPATRRTMIWTVIITSVAVFMAGLDNLVVTMALPSIKEHLHASLASLEWTVNAYTLTFAVLLLTGATLGERFGRRRIFTLGLAIFTLASAGAALAPDTAVLVAARAIQGAGGALVLPLSLTILSSAVPAARRGAALGFWGAMSGLAVAAGLAAFTVWELRAPAPMLPLRLLRSRGFTATNAASFLFSAGMFGSIFLLAQFLQVAGHYSPLSAGLRTLPWTGMPMVVAPLAGPLSDRWGGRPLIITGLVLQAAGLAWLALITTPGVAYTSLIAPFVISGVGMALFFVPVANTVLSSVRPDQEGIASGANNAIRELGGVFGIAVLASVFSARGGYASGVSFAHGLDAAVWVGAAIVAAAAAAAVLIPRRRARRAAQPAEAPVSGIDLAETAAAQVTAAG